MARTCIRGMRFPHLSIIYHLSTGSQIEPRQLLQYEAILKVHAAAAPLVHKLRIMHICNFMLKRCMSVAHTYLR